jgi:sterol desaturase/sphingolipid hydroxylase (fatty acid hydroxylase superfamily)
MKSVLLVWMPMVVTLNLLPFLTFNDAILELLIVELHLVPIHSDTCFVYDDILDRLGLVTSKTYHVHHLRQAKNLGHVFWIWDYLGGTFLSWEEMVQNRT